MEYAIKARIPLRDYGTKDDIVDACLWLASEAARYVAGAIITWMAGRNWGMRAFRRQFDEG